MMRIAHEMNVQSVTAVFRNLDNPHGEAGTVMGETEVQQPVDLGQGEGVGVTLNIRPDHRPGEYALESVRIRSVAGQLFEIEPPYNVRFTVLEEPRLPPSIQKFNFRQA